MTTDLPTDRPLPDFVVIGAMRAGTTTFHTLLEQTGRVSLSSMKETDFFMTQDRFDRGPDWFRRRFSDLSRPVGDISPNYTKREIFPYVPDRIHATNPDAKLIYIVRDPVARAVSQYRVAQMHHADIPTHDGFLEHSEGRHIVDGSRYAYQLEPYLAFWSIDQILILDFDELRANPTHVLNQTFNFIGVPQLEGVVGPAHTNATVDVGRLPSWWMSLRSTALGEAVRTMLPRSLVDRAKRSVSGRIDPNVERLPDQSLRDTIREAVASDVERFRSLTGRSFKSWSV